MEIVRLILLFGHLIGMGLLVGRRRGKLSEPTYRLFAVLVTAGIAVAVFWR